MLTEIVAKPRPKTIPGKGPTTDPIVFMCERITYTLEASPESSPPRDAGNVILVYGCRN